MEKRHVHVKFISLMLWTKYLRAQIFDLIQPVLDCQKLAGVAKVFVLNHCRGLQNFNLAQKVWIDANNNMNGSDANSGHLLDDCLFFYSTAPGNPAVRNTYGSLYFKACFRVNRPYKNIVFEMFIQYLRYKTAQY